VTIESLWRLAAFLAVLGVLLAGERRWPRYAVPPGRGAITRANLWLGAVDVLTLRLLLPWLAYDMALWAQRESFGLLHQVPVGTVAAAIAGFLALDLAIYLQHRAFHAVPALWRLHAVHHADAYLDASSGLRFHPLEIVLSMLWKMLWVGLLGIAPAVVIAFEVTLSAASLLTHTSWRVHSGLERALGSFLITPAVHRMHHELVAAPDRNFGSTLLVWDLIFGTRVIPLPGIAHSLGIRGEHDQSQAKLLSMLKMPLNI
jgi:sterol desaturase/sphingolipid hydroxylase (fatty acid hydroxylase superfamily)